MLKAKINNKTYDVSAENGQPIVNGNPLTWDLTRINETTFHILYQNKVILLS